jgi:copper chaperone CopZ
MRTLLLIPLAALVIGAVACAKDNGDAGTDKASTEAAAKVATATTPTTPTSQTDQAAVSCDTPGENAEGMCGKQEEGGCNKWDDDAAAIAKRDVPTNAVWKTLKVSGMTCGGCERRVIAHVGKLDGVVSVEADSELGQVRVALASDKADAAEAAQAEIKRLGYRVE